MRGFLFVGTRRTIYGLPGFVMGSKSLRPSVYAHAMCGRLFLQDPQAFPSRAEDLGLKFERTALPDEVQQPRYNAAPMQPLLVLAGESGVPARLAAMRWGLVPSWAKDDSMAGKLINARGETVLEKASFRGPIRRRRCLVAAGGFYEWQKLPSDSKSGSKRPHAVRPATGDGPIAFAGLWDRWHDPVGDGSAIETVTICTCEPNDLLRRLHHRMAVILPEEQWSDWIDCDRVDGETAAAMLKPIPSEMLRAYPISPRVGSVGNDDPSLLDPVEEVEKPTERQGTLFG